MHIFPALYISSTERLFLDHNSLTGTMRPICKGEADLTVDVAVECDDNCCSSHCPEQDDNCNLPDGTLIKLDYNLISREAYVFGEDFKLAEADSPED